ncbi:MAG: cell wall hydrolase [Vallitaleaceae bacterium]|nr:cell wall hydrolase [Vallitaleaceae bacterium]
MMRFKKLLGRIFVSFKSLTKKAFTKGLVIVTAGMVTVLMLGTNGFIVNSKTNPEPTIEQNDENLDEDIAPQIPVLSEMDLPASQQLQTSEEKLNITRHTSTLLKEVEDNKTVFQTASNHALEETELAIYTEEDFMSLVKIVEAEATGEDLIGKIMVANVVLNRVKSDAFPDTIHDVIYEKYNGKSQFSPVDDGRLESVPLTESSYEAVERALKGEDYSEGATFFVAHALTSEVAGSWFDENLNKVAQHGVHTFYSY